MDRLSAINSSNILVFPLHCDATRTVSPQHSEGTRKELELTCHVEQALEYEMPSGYKRERKVVDVQKGLRLKRPADRGRRSEILRKIRVLTSFIYHEESPRPTEDEMSRPTDLARIF